MKSTAKKSMAEIIGLLVIVVIVVIVFLFVSLGGKNKTSEYTQDAMQASISQSVIDTILRSSSDCLYPLKSFIEDCFDRDIIKCNGKTACDYSSEKISMILNSNYPENSKAYSFYVKKGDEKKIELNPDLKCTEDMDKIASGIGAIHTAKENIILTLEICK